MNAAIRKLKLYALLYQILISFQLPAIKASMKPEEARAVD